MSNFKSFLKTLKRIGYNDIEMLDETDLQLLLSDKKLGSFLEVFCTLDESNVLSSEEIQEYSALTVDELSELEELQKNDQYPEKDGCSEECKMIDCHSLQEKLNLIEKNHIKVYEQQIERMKKYEESLFQELEALNLQLLDAKKKFQLYELSVLPQAENEFVSSMMSVLKNTEELNSLISQANSPESELPASSSFEETVKEYLKAESMILQCVQVFLDKNFPMEENVKVLSFVQKENSENADLFKEALFLQKLLKEQILKKIKAETDIEKLTASLKFFQSDKASESLKHHHLQLIEKLADASKVNEKLKKSHEELNMYLSNAVSKYVDEQFSKIAASIEKKTRNCLQHALNEMSLPQEALLCQRARLELLMYSLKDYKQRDLESMKHLLNNSILKLKQEKFVLEERIGYMADLKEENLQQCGLNPETSIYLSIFAILGLPQERLIQDLDSITLEDVLLRANKLYEAKNNLRKNFDEKLKIVNLMENQATSMEATSSGSCPDYANWHEAEHIQSTDLNKLSLKVASLKTNLAECNKEFEHKEKSLQAKKNLAVARMLYVNALTDPEHFKECVNSIQEAVKNTADY